MSPVAVVAVNDSLTVPALRVMTSPSTLCTSMRRADPLSSTGPFVIRAMTWSRSACVISAPFSCWLVTVSPRATAGGSTMLISPARPHCRNGDDSPLIAMRVSAESLVTVNGCDPARVELIMRMSARGSVAARSAVMRTAIGSFPVSTTSERIAVGRDWVLVMTRNVDSPNAAALRPATVPSTSTAAAAVSTTRIAVRPLGDSGGGAVEGACGGGAIVVTVVGLSVSGFEIAQNRQHAAVFALIGSQVQFGEDRRDVFLGGAGGDVQCRGDRGVRFALRHQLQHIAFAWRQLGEDLPSVRAHQDL